MVRMVCISLFFVLSGCVTTADSAIDVNSLKDKGGDGLRGAYEDAKRAGAGAIQKEYVVGLKKNRVYDLSEPGIPVRQPAKTRTYWVSPRVGDTFATHGGWLTVLVQKEGFVGSPLRGSYIPTETFTGKEQTLNSPLADQHEGSLQDKIQQTLDTLTQ